MRLLFFMAYYPPEIAASLYLFENIAQDLTGYGFDVDLVTPLPVRGVDKAARIRYRSTKELKKEVSMDGKLIIHRIWVPFTENHGLFIRAIRYFFLTSFMFLKGLTMKADIITITSTPPIIQALAIGLLGRIKGVPVVYQLTDIFPNSLITSGKMKVGLFTKFAVQIEKLSYKIVTHIIAISNDFRKILIQKNVPTEKIDVVYIWVDENAVTPIKREDNILFDRYNLDRDAFIVSYNGNVGLSQNLEMLLDLAKELEVEKQIQFVVLGDGANRESLINYAKKQNLKNIFFLPFQPYEDIAHVYSMGDIGIVISKKGAGSSMIPSKTWSIMSAARPVIASFDLESSLCAIVEEANSGVCVPPDDYNSFKNAVLDLYINKSKCIELGENARRFILEKGNRSGGTAKIATILKRVLGKHNKSN